MNFDATSRSSHALSEASRSTEHAADQHANERYTSKALSSPPLEEDEEQAARLQNLALGRGSNDSQASEGPLTPIDESSHQVQLASGGDKGDSYLVAPRRAPPPPALAPRSPSRDKRRSFPQSMMKTLAGRKKETVVPPPLAVSGFSTTGGSLPNSSSSQLIAPNSQVSTSVEMAPIVHHVTLPEGFVRNSPLPHSPLVAKAQAFRKKSVDARSEPRTPKTPVFIALVRSLRTSASRKNSTTSITSSNARLSISTATASPNMRANSQNGAGASPRPHLVVPRSNSLAVPTLHITDRLAPPPILPLAAARTEQLSPMQRPKTAPMERTFVGKTGSPATQSSVSLANSPVPEFANRPVGMFDLEYVNPWSKTFTSSASYVSQIPISPGESVRSRQNLKRFSRSEASLYKQSILEGPVRPVVQEQTVSAIYARTTPAQAPSTGFSEVSKLPNFLSVTPSMFSFKAVSPALSLSQPTVDTWLARQGNVIYEQPQQNASSSDQVFRNPFAGSAPISTSNPMSISYSYQSSVTQDSSAATPSSSHYEVEIPAQQQKAPTPLLALQPSPTPGLQDIFDDITSTSAPTFRNPFLLMRSVPNEVAWDAVQTKQPAVPVETSPRRPSGVSIQSQADHFDFPTRPTKLEARRQTGFTGRGLRVSLDADIL